MSSADGQLNKPTANALPPLAIVGIGCLFPKADGPETYWHNIKEGVDAITDIPESHWKPSDYFDDDPTKPDMTYARRGGFIDPVQFDPLHFGIAPNNIEATDTTQLLGMHVAEQALLDAGYETGTNVGDGRAFDRDRCSVIMGVTGTLELVIPLGARLGHPIWRKALEDAGVDQATADYVVERIADGYVPWQENSFPGLLGNVAAGRIANRFDLGGTNCVVDAACASSLSAIHMAAMELYAGRSDMAITGGIDTFNDIFMYMCFSKTPALSPTGNSKPFSADGDGTILGEGMGVVVLKRLDDAIRDGDKVYCVIKGIGTSSDGKGNAIYAPSVKGQTKALRDAYKTADVTPDTIELIEAHGTGTKVGDATEVNAIEEVYGEAVSRTSEIKMPWCAIGSVKSMVGHTKAAAGVAGLIKTALAVNRKVLPPTIKVEQPLEVIGRSQHVYVNAEKRPWLASPTHPRRAALSAFGFGGSNFHCVVEEFAADQTAAPAVDWSGRVQMLSLSADSTQALQQQLDTVTPQLDVEWADLRELAASYRSSFNASEPCRLILVFEKDITDIARLVANAKGMLSAKPDASHWSLPDGAYFGRGSITGDLAFIFPGQGSQYVNMLRDLACQFPQVRTTLEAANSEFQASDVGLALSDLVFPRSAFSPEAKQQFDVQLRDTRVAQPAIGGVSMGAAGVLEYFGVRPDAVAGHSFGELTALAVSGRINERALYRLARQRGALMHEQGASDSGSMLAVQASRDEVQRVLDASALDVVVANHNAPKQTVLSGTTAAIGEAEQLFKSKNFRATRLPVAAAFHSTLVSGACEPFGKVVDRIAFDADINSGRQNGRSISVFANSTGERYPHDAAAARELLANQLARPVEFVRQIESMVRSGVRMFVEVGPSNKLTGLIRSILEGLNSPEGSAAQAFALDTSSGRRHGEFDLACTLAQVAASGRPVDLVKWDDPTVRRPRKEVNKRRMTIALTGANYVKPRESKPAKIVELDKVAEATSTGPPKNVVKEKTPEQTGEQTQVSAPVQANSIVNAPASQGAPIQANRQTNSVASQMPPVTKPTVTRRDPVNQSSPQSENQSSAVPMTATSPEQLAYALQVTQQHILALQRMQEQTALLHRQYLEGQDASQHTIQSLVQQQQQLLNASIGAGVPSFPVMTSPTPVATPAAQPVPIQAAPPPPTPAVHAPPVAAPIAPATSVAPVAPVTPPAPAPRVVADPPAPVLTPAPVQAAPPAQSSPVVESTVSGNGRFESLLLEVVADKTGYPVDMLEVDMSLDADLGIDSIKRVEILSAFQDRAPDAPAVKPEDLGALQTLRQIIDFVEGAASPEGPNTTTAHDNGESMAALAPSSNGSLETVLLEVVADKTGYPVDMLDLDMSLDADLGIDSIKRVEILSAFQDRVPDAPSVKPEDLGALQTLRQIVDFLNGSPPDSAVPSPPDTPVAAGRAPDPFDLAVAGAGLERLVLTTASFPTTDSAQNRTSFNWPAGSNVIITDDGEGFSTLIAEQFRHNGYESTVIGIDALSNMPIDAAAVIVVAPAQPESDFNARAFGFVQKTHAALEAFRERTNSHPFLGAICRLDGSFGVAGDAMASPITAGLCGLIKTAAREWLDIQCKVIDLAPSLVGDDAASRIVDECQWRGPIEVGLSAGGACVPQLVRDTTIEASDSPLKQGDVVLISGGARGVTAEVAVALAQHSQPTLVLLGRSALPEDEPAWLQGVSDESAMKRELIAHWQDGAPTPKAVQAAYEKLLASREIRASLGRMESAGSKVIYRSVDIRDVAAVSSVTENIRQQYGPICGIVHGAGVLADRLIVDKTAEQFDRVYGTKVEGFQALLQATRDDDLRVVVTFASSTARFGRVGQSDYAIANEVLNKLAQQQTRLRPQCKVLSINWGPWDGGMVTPALKQMFADEGVAVIPLESGAQYLAHELSTPLDGPVEIVILGEGSSVDVDVADVGNSDTKHAARTLNDESGSHQDQSEVQQSTDQATLPSPALSLVFERQVSVESHAFLRSHVIGGRAVLPMAMMIEWMAHGALHANPGMVFAGFDALRVFRGVKLESDQMLALQVFAASPRFDAAGEHVDLELRCGEVLHARAGILLKPDYDLSPTDRPALPTSAYAHDLASIYKSPRLFHGAALQGIRAIEACDVTGIVGWCQPSLSPAQWMASPWRSNWIADPMALDVAFQLMILWSIEQADAPSLPTGAGSYRQFRSRFPSDGVRVICHVTESKPYSAIADIDFVDTAGDLVARMEGYECVVEGALRESFEQNNLFDQVGA